jgi:hypothetical protein
MPKAADNELALIADMKSAEDWWLKPHLRVRQFLANLPASRKMAVRGEDFMADPDAHLLKIVHWLGLDAGTSAIETMKHPERSPFAHPGPLGARFGNDPSFLESPALRPYTAKPVRLDTPLKADGATLGNEVRQLATEYGYQ